MSLFSRFADWLIERAKRRPYRKGHLLHADGSLYMGRYCLFESRWLSARVHHIATADLDRHMHDHPWNFVSLVLRGGYLELRPATLEPCFELATRWWGLEWDGELQEQWIACPRTAGSVAFRRATDRHRVSLVSPSTWTLFVYGPALQWWGFYTPQGKIHWKDYATCHAAVGVSNDQGEVANVERD
jgi:hypothetical protein